MRWFLIVGAAGAALALPAPSRHPAPPLPQPRPLTPVIIDAGHGGDDLGAVAGRLYEKNLALEFARKLQTRLERTGQVPVALTRENDSFVPLDRRVASSVDWSGTVFVSLHINQHRSRKLSGIVIFSYGPDRRRPWRRPRHPAVPPLPAPPREQVAESEQLSRAFTVALRAGGFHVAPAKSDYYVLKNPSQPSVLIELGYMSNPRERALLADPAYQDRVVESLARAIEKYAQKRLTAALAPAAAAPEL